LSEDRSQTVSARISLDIENVIPIRMLKDDPIRHHFGLEIFKLTRRLGVQGRPPVRLIVLSESSECGGPLSVIVNEVPVVPRHPQPPLNRSTIKRRREEVNRFNLLRVGSPGVLVDHETEEGLLRQSQGTLARLGTKTSRLQTLEHLLEINQVFLPGAIVR
jgi:hypothetical protein